MLTTTKQKQLVVQKVSFFMICNLRNIKIHILNLHFSLYFSEPCGGVIVMYSELLKEIKRVDREQMHTMISRLQKMERDIIEHRLDYLKKEKTYRTKCKKGLKKYQRYKECLTFRSKQSKGKKDNISEQNNNDFYHNHVPCNVDQNGHSRTTCIRQTRCWKSHRKYACAHNHIPETDPLHTDSNNTADVDDRYIGYVWETRV